MPQGVSAEINKNTPFLLTAMDYNYDKFVILHNVQMGNLNIVYI